MRRYVLLALDLGLVCLATLFSLALRENFEIGSVRFFDFIPYMIATTACASLVLLAFGLDRTVWRFTSQPDHVRIVAASAIIIVGAVSITFAYNRLEGVARSLPVLQLLACPVFLIGARVLHKIIHDARQHKKASVAFLQLSEKAPHPTILVVGISKLTEAYLQAIAELAPGTIRIAGLLGHANRHVGRLVATHTVLGVPSEIEHVLDGLDVHGVAVDQIVIASPFKSLAESEREALLRVERSRGISLRFLAEALGFERDGQIPASGRTQKRRADRAREMNFQIPQTELKLIASRPYWAFKRAIDCLGALILLVICSPFMALAAVLVGASVGLPVLFWQQRPGLGGRAFHVYKLRTMRPAHSTAGRRLSDKERVSQIGSLMRRLRLDELPQLFNILRGDMSFIGPRPLLPRDQSDAYRARLLVRPGLTGWAQVVGGRDILPEDKAALDIWYVRNANLALDLEIVARTIPIVFFGERISRPLIERAWRDLSEGGVLKGNLAYKVGHSLGVNSFPA